MRLFFFCLGVLLIGTAKGNDAKKEPTAENENDGVKLTCPDGYWKRGGNKLNGSLSLPYKDEKSGIYQCYNNKDENEEEPDPRGTIYVRLRTCETCIELDTSALVGIVLGNVVATILIGIAVYSISTQSKGPSFPSNKASQESDRRNLIPNDSTYQSLTNSGRDAYEVLHTRRR